MSRRRIQRTKKQAHFEFFLGKRDLIGFGDSAEALDTGDLRTHIRNVTRRSHEAGDVVA